MTAETTEAIINPQVGPSHLHDEKLRAHPSSFFKKTNEENKKTKLIVLNFMGHNAGSKTNLWTRRNFASKKEKYEIHILTPDPQDFDRQGQLKPSALKNYKIMEGVTGGDKVVIFGHGVSNDPGYIASETGGYTRKETSYFSAAMPASILKRIKDLTIRKNIKELRQMQKLPEKSLKITLIVCEGENFSGELHKELYKDKKSVVLCAITAPKRTHYINISPLLSGRKAYQHKYFSIPLILMAANFLAVVPASVAVKTQNIDWAFATVASVFSLFIITLIGLAVFYGTSNSRHKVITVPDFEALRNASIADEIPCRVIAKNDFKAELNKNDNHSRSNEVS